MFVVAGITGNTGKIVANALRATGKTVKAFIRNPERAAELKAEGFEVALGDLEDSAALAKALKGATGAYVLVPPFYGENIIEHQKRVASSISKALQQAKVPRVVLLSSIGAEHPEGTGPIVTCYHLEQACKDIPGVSFLRAAYFMENLLAVASVAQEQGVFPHFLPEQAPFPLVATADIGRAASELLLQEDAPPRVVQLAGPEDLIPRQIAEQFSQVLAKPVTAASAPTSEVVSTFMTAGVPEELAHQFQELYEAAHRGQLRFERGQVRRGTLPLSDVLCQALTQEEGPTAAAQRAVDDYLVGSYRQDEKLLDSAFAEEAVVILPSARTSTNGSNSAQRLDKAGFIERVLAASPSEYPYEKRIVAVNAHRNSAQVAAIARVGGNKFLDHLHLERDTTGAFRIVRKTYEPAPSSQPQP
jgi:uncharacterized protein YbjT (DUF2867 family)